MNQNKYEMVALEDVCEKITDGTHQTPTYCDDGVTFLSSKNVKSGRIDWDNVKHVPRELHEEYQKRIQPQLGDLLLAKNGTTGVAALVDRDDIEFNIYVSLALLRPTNKIDGRFLYYAVNSTSAKRQFNSSLKGVGVPNLHLKEIRKTLIPLPPLSEQKRIADILDKAGAIRRKRQHAMLELEEILLASYLDIFGDPVLSRQNVQTVDFGSLVDFATGFAFKSSGYSVDGVKLCRGANVFPDKLDWSDLRCWPNEDSVLEKYRLQIDDVVLAMDRPWISTGTKVALVTAQDIPCHLVQRVARLRANNGISSAYLYFTIRHPAFTAHCGGLKTETTVPHISAEDIRSFQVATPRKTDHELFQKIASESQKAFKRLSYAANEAASVFSSLSQIAFAGEL